MPLDTGVRRRPGSGAWPRTCVSSQAGKGTLRPDGTHRTVRAPGSLAAGVHACADRLAAGGKVVDFTQSSFVYLSHSVHVSLKLAFPAKCRARVSTKRSLDTEQGLSQEPRVGPARCPCTASVSRHTRTGPKSKGTTSLRGPQLLGETCPGWRGGRTGSSWVTGPHTSVCGLG